MTIPVSIKTSDLIYDSYQSSVEQTIETANQNKEEIDAKKKENEQLTNNLRETLEVLLVSLGRNKNEVKTMTQGEQRKLVKSFAKEQLSSKAAVEAMSQEITKLEVERLGVSRAKEAVSLQLEKSKRAQLQLETENKLLNKRIQELSEELSTTKLHMQEVSTNQDTEKDKLQEMIRTLKAQLRKDETSELKNEIWSFSFDAVVTASMHCYFFYCVVLQSLSHFFFSFESGLCWSL